MVEIDPDTDEFIDRYEGGDLYHVSFLDKKVTRGWFDEKKIQPFKQNNPIKNVS